MLMSETPKMRLNCRAELHGVKSCYSEAAHRKWWWKSNCQIILTVHLKNSSVAKTVGLLQNMSQWDIPEVCLFCCPRTKEKFLSLLHAKSKTSSTDSSMKVKLVCLYLYFSHFFLYVHSKMQKVLNSTFSKARSIWKVYKVEWTAELGKTGSYSLAPNTRTSWIWQE